MWGLPGIDLYIERVRLPEFPLLSVMYKCYTDVEFEPLHRCAWRRITWSSKFSFSFRVVMCCLHSSNSSQLAVSSVVDGAIGGTGVKRLSAMDHHAPLSSLVPTLNIHRAKFKTGGGGTEHSGLPPPRLWSCVFP